MSARKLLILDLNGVLVSYTSAKHQPRQSKKITYGQHGIHYIANKVYFARMRLHQFLAHCFERFDVAIWTCVGTPRTDAMVKGIFTEEEQKKFKFIWDSSRTMDSKVRRRDGHFNVMFKDLTTVWNTPEFVGLYDDSNTVLIDDSPLKTFLNPDFTSLYPTPLKFGDCKDTFLPDILWPLLQKLSLARDVK